ncbi:MAG: glycosyltransferase [Rhizorhabdus sp.]|uniref:glycosyltransferase n=1 Tax=Rhizorhabdus sp. TaxID=1968843 RepID=UPI001B42345C|nr:glycosyltransferase [Rhizorhabdus sp.]MBP8231998.1 glycosyltransferase [Rhizorhabdus sp.]
MLRVLTLSSLYPSAARPGFGGFVERQTLALASRSDVEVKVVAPFAVPPFGAGRWLPAYRALLDLPEREMRNGIEVYRPRFPTVPGVGGRINPWSLGRTVAPLLARIRRDFAFDVIDAEFFYPDGPAAVALGQRFGVPVSIKARGSDIHFWSGQKGCRDQIIRAGRAADGMLAVSGALRSDMIALGLPGERIRVHPTGVDQTLFAPMPRGEAKAALGIDGPLVVSIGNLIPLKGHELLIEAMTALPGVTLVIAGQGPERDRLASRIASAGLQDRVRLLGALPHAALPALLSAADVMALASASEGLANVWVEALACGTPIVITDVGGARELVMRAEAGRIVDRTAEAFASGIAEMLAGKPDSAVVRSTVANFTWERNSAALFDHLAGLVAARR